LRFDLDKNVGVFVKSNMKIRGLLLRNSIQCLFALIPLLLATFWLSAGVQAVTPTPDGAYTGANTAEGGSGALFSLKTGSNNTALGSQALYGVTTGIQNTATGAQALMNNTANGNTANGFQALVKNTIGSSNTGAGWRALFENTSGTGNTATGDSALYGNTNGFGNTAIGAQALFSNMSGTENTAIGANALYHNITGTFNAAIGDGALSLNDGSANTAIGEQALVLNAGGAHNTAIGFMAGSQVSAANHFTCLGADVAGADVSSTTWIANVFGVTTQSGTTAPVVVSDGGQLGTIASSERFKKDIASMDKSSEAILSLRPVTFHYKTDTKGTPQFGLIAEEVAKANPALVLPDKEGKPYTVRYDAVNAMLLNEFLKEHSTVEKLRSMVAELSRRLEKQDSKIQKMSDQLVTSKAAPHRVASR
jgi:hypothetical protein